MIDSKIIEILRNHNNEVAEEISSINLSINRISDALNSVSDFLMNELLSYSKNTGVKNIDKELKLLKDSQFIREYINTLKIIDFNNNCSENKSIEDKPENIIQLSLHDVIVLGNTLNCHKNHNVYDINAILPILKRNGTVTSIKVLASYCENCDRYTINKEVFNNIDGVVLCEVINNTAIVAGNDNDAIMDLAQHESILYRYGYNVKANSNLSTKQRHIIIASLVESGILTRNQVIDHLTTLINRGEQITNWKDATEKWKQDRYFTSKYKKENLPDVIANKILLEYKCKK